MASPVEPTPVEQVLKQQGRSMSWLARQADVDQSYAWRMLRGERPLTDDFKAAAVRALGVPESFLFPAQPVEQAS